MATPRKTATGQWRVQIEVKGVRDSATRATKREATEWAHQRSVEIRAADGGKLGEVRTLAEAMRRYGEEVSSTKKGWRSELIRLAAFQRHPHLPHSKKLADITPADIVAWRDARLKVNARGSVLREMTLLSHVFSVARRDWQWIGDSPMADVRRPQEPDHRERLISGPEIRRMLRQLGWSRKPCRSVSQSIGYAFLFALQTGARAGEICGITWATIKADQCAVDGKTGPRALPLTPTARRTIEAMRGFDDVTVFGIKSQSLDALFRRARDRAGLAGFTFHDSRHTAATRLAGRLHVLELCKVFGWSSTTRALTYFNPTASTLAGKMA